MGVVPTSTESLSIWKLSADVAGCESLLNPFLRKLFPLLIVVVLLITSGQGKGLSKIITASHFLSLLFFVIVYA